MSVIVKALRPCATDSGRRVVAGYRDDGTAIVRGEPLLREKGSFFLASDSEARDLIRRAAAEEPREAGKLGELAEATLSARSPREAALAGLSIRDVLVWRAVPDDDSWMPAQAPLGLGRDPFDARFSSSADIEECWRRRPGAVPMFSFLHEAGHRAAYVWRDRALLQIPTSITRLGSR